MKARNLLCTLAVVFCCLAILQPSASAQAFSLKSGDTVVFYGDSITEQNFYNQWVELYTVTRFPAMRVHFYGAGVGGDRVTGGGGGTIDERLARDVFRYKPTVVTVMLGMNDGHNGTTPDEINANYTKGYEHILQSVQQHAPGVRITLLGPSPFDEVTRPVGAKGSYNAVMVHFADVDRELAAKYNASFVDFNTPVVAVLEKAEALDPLAAKLFLPDRVHPDTIVHWVMAEALLKGWNAPALVSSVTIDAAAAKVVDAQNATVDHVERANGTLSWTATENALPLPLMSTNEKDALLIQLTDIQQALNQEPLRVTGLDAAQYTLTIDGKDMGSFSAADLAKGINLADYATPMRSQAQTVGWTMRDREDTHFIHMRMFIKKADTGASAGKPDLMDAFEDMMEDAMYAAATPKPHVFALSVAAVTP